MIRLADSGQRTRHGTQLGGTGDQEHMEMEMKWSRGAHKSKAANAGVCTSLRLLLAFIGIGSLLREIRIQIAYRKSQVDFKTVY